jgi:hypothetical protein
MHGLIQSRETVPLSTAIAYDIYDLLYYVSLFIIYLCQSLSVYNTQNMYFYMNKIKIIYLLLSLYCMLRNVTQMRNSYENKVSLILHLLPLCTDNTQMVYCLFKQSLPKHLPPPVTCIHFT